MQLLFKNEKKMNREEKTKIELMRSLSVLFHGIDFSEDRIFDLTSNSTKFIQASILMERFDIKLKDEDSYNVFHPSDTTTFPGEKKFNEIYIEKDKSRMEMKNRYIEETLGLLDVFSESTEVKNGQKNSKKRKTGSTEKKRKEGMEKTV